jgi:hypothetical protein
MTMMRSDDVTMLVTESFVPSGVQPHNPVNGKASIYINLYTLNGILLLFGDGDDFQCQSIGMDIFRQIQINERILHCYGAASKIGEIRKQGSEISWEA